MPTRERLSPIQESDLVQKSKRRWGAAAPRPFCAEKGGLGPVPGALAYSGISRKARGAAEVVGMEGTASNRKDLQQQLRLLLQRGWRCLGNKVTF
jgi:hypothetical protein